MSLWAEKAAAAPCLVGYQTHRGPLLKTTVTSVTDTRARDQHPTLRQSQPRVTIPPAPTSHAHRVWAEALAVASMASIEPAPLAVRTVADRLGLSVEAAGRRIRTAAACGLIIIEQTYTDRLARLVRVAPAYAWLRDLHRGAHPLSHPAFSPSALGADAWLALALAYHGHTLPAWLTAARERMLALTGTARPGMGSLRRLARRLGLHRERAAWTETIAAHRAAYHGQTNPVAGDPPAAPLSPSVRTPLPAFLAPLLTILGTLSDDLLALVLDQLDAWATPPPPPTPPAHALTAPLPGLSHAA